MKPTATTILIIFALSCSVVFGQGMIKKLDKGKILYIDVKPIGDRATNPMSWHTIRIIKTDSLFSVELRKAGEVKNTVLQRGKMIEICNFIENWGGKRYTWWNRDYHVLSYDKIRIKIGCRSSRFRSEIGSDDVLLDIFAD
ncbi:MAG: hypothetical protein WCM76_16580 [Bacteroidota bacterium]